VLTLCGCAAGPASRSATAIIQNNTDDPALTELAAEVLTKHLELNAVDTERFELLARLDAPPEGGLQIQILCSARSDHQLLAQVRVKAQGGKNGRLLQAMMSKAARDVAADCH
jgi:hypothetical protein